MKHTFSNAQCAHVWASQSQDYGRGSSLSFNGPTIKSYSTNMATFVRPNVVFVNVEHYSVTTSKHQGHIWRALSDDLKIFKVFNDAVLNTRPESLKSIRAYYVDEMNTMAIKFTRARLNAEYILREWRRTRSMLEDFCKTFKRAIPKYLDIDNSVGLGRAIDCARKQTEQVRKESEAKRQIRAKLQMEINNELPQRRALWLNGVSNESLQICKSESGVYLRQDVFTEIMLRRMGKEIETSNGARIPYGAGQMLFNRWRLSPSKLIGKHAGSFEIVESDAAHIRAGCTTITAQEINRFAKQENWL